MQDLKVFTASERGEVFSGDHRCEKGAVTECFRDRLPAYLFVHTAGSHSVIMFT
jgi:hypothetical protein